MNAPLILYELCKGKVRASTNIHFFRVVICSRRSIRRQQRSIWQWPRSIMLIRPFIINTLSKWLCFLKFCQKDETADQNRWRPKNECRKAFQLFVQCWLCHLPKQIQKQRIWHTVAKNSTDYVRGKAFQIFQCSFQGEVGESVRSAMRSKTIDNCSKNSLKA